MPAPNCRGIFGPGQGLIFQPTGADYSDSLQATPESIGGVGSIRSNALANLRFHVPRGATNVTVFASNNMAGESSAGVPIDVSISMYVDGVFFQAGTPTIVNLTNAFLFVLDGQAHDVEITASYQQYNPAIVGDILGTFISSVAVYGSFPTIQVNPTVGEHWTLYTDSIGDGALATVASHLGFASLLRQANPTKRISVEAWGGRALWDDSGNVGGYGFPSLNALASRLVGLQFNAPVRKYVLIIGVNDWSPGFNHWTSDGVPNSYGPAMGALLDQIHAQDPAGIVRLVTPFITGVESTANGFGKLVADYRTAAAAQGAARPGFVTVIPGPSVSSAAFLEPDQLHFNNAGHQFIADNLGPLI